MRLIIELDGVVFDTRRTAYAAYALVAGEMKAAKRNEVDFWRLTRTGANAGEFLPGTRPPQWLDYDRRYAEAIETDEHLELLDAQPTAADVLERLRRKATLIGVTLGANRAMRQRRIDALGLDMGFTELHGLPAERDRRRQRLDALASEDRRTIICIGTEAMARTAAAGNAFVVGVSSGPCAATRLRRAGVATIFDDLGGLADEIGRGAPMLIQDGLLPPQTETARLL